MSDNAAALQMRTEKEANERTVATEASAALVQMRAATEANERTVAQEASAALAQMRAAKEAAEQAESAGRQQLLGFMAELAELRELFVASQKAAGADRRRLAELEHIAQLSVRAPPAATLSF